MKSEMSKGQEFKVISMLNDQQLYKKNTNQKFNFIYSKTKKKNNNNIGTINMGKYN